MWKMIWTGLSADQANKKIGLKEFGVEVDRLLHEIWDARAEMDEMMTPGKVSPEEVWYQQKLAAEAWTATMRAQKPARPSALSGTSIVGGPLHEDAKLGTDTKQMAEDVAQVMASRCGEAADQIVKDWNANSELDALQIEAATLKALRKTCQRENARLRNALGSMGAELEKVNQALRRSERNVGIYANKTLRAVEMMGEYQDQVSAVKSILEDPDNIRKVHSIRAMLGLDQKPNVQG